jgi:hypothetical protein
MITKNDLYDISAAFTIVRNDSKCIKNKEVLEAIKQVLSSDKQIFTDNQIRIALSGIDGLDRDKWYFAFHNNIYVNHHILKNDKIYDLLIHACDGLIQVLQKEDYANAYDLADGMHCLPDIIADNNFTVTKSYWKSHILPYRKKWDNTFLINEQKVLK